MNLLRNVCYLAVAGSVAGLPRPAAAADLYRNVLSGSSNTLTNINGWSTTTVATGAAPASVAAGDRLVFSNYWTPSLAGAAPALWINAANTQSVTAASGSISQISDLSGNGRNATQTTVGNRPTYVTGSMNGLQVARFDGTDDFLNLVSFAQQSGQSVMTAVDTTNLAQGDRAFLGRSFASGAQNAPAPYLWGVNMGANLRPASYWGPGGSIDDWRAGISTNNAPARGPTILDFGYSTSGANGTATTRINGGTTSGTTFAQTTAGGIGISENWTSIGNAVQAPGMDLGEVIVYSGTISATDRQKTEAYFSAKWGIALDASNDNPFANTIVRADNTTYLAGDHSVAGLLFSGTGTATTLLGGTSGGPAANSLTLGGDGILVNAGVLATTLGNASSGGVSLVVGADQAWTNDSAATLVAHNAISRAAGDTVDRTLTVAGSGATVLNGDLANGGAAGVLGLTKNGAGPLTLTGSSGYTGATTVNAGSLLVNGQLGNTAVTVNSGGLLGGSGSIAGGVTVAAGGTFSPGNSPGLLSVGTLDLAGSTLMEIDGVVPRGASGGYDATDVTGQLTYGGSLLIDFGAGITSALADNTTFDLFAFGSFSESFASITTAADGSFYGGLTFASTGGGDTWTATKDTQTLEFTHSTGNLVIVPEPGAMPLAGLGIAAAAWALRRRADARR